MWIVNKPQVGDDVLYFASMVEAGAAYELIGHTVAYKGFFQGS